MAVSDPGGLLAQPVGALERQRQPQADDLDIQQVLEAVAQYQVERVVVGIPVSLDGMERRQARLVRRFCAALRKVSPVPVNTWDERFSTLEAERLLHEAGAKPSRERGRLDAAAAAVVLQGYLDFRNRDAASNREGATP